jgi:hypothetical protein
LIPLIQNVIPHTEITNILNTVSALSYPAWLTSAAPYLPALNLECIATSGTDFLNQAVTSNKIASVSGFLNAVSTGCSTSTLSLSGGYDSDRQELEVNIIVMLGGSRNM